MILESCFLVLLSKTFLNKSLKFVMKNNMFLEQILKKMFFVRSLPNLFFELENCVQEYFSNMAIFLLCS